MDIALTLLGSSGGINKLQGMLISDWIGPAFLLVVAALSIKFVVQRQFRELATFLVIAAIVAVLIFAGEQVFGSGGWFTNLGKSAAELIGNFINLHWLKL